MGIGLDQQAVLSSGANFGDVFTCFTDYRGYDTYKF